MKPEILAYHDVKTLKQRHPEVTTDDFMQLAIDELYDIAYPAKKDQKKSKDVEAYGKTLTGGNHNNWGNWIYYPWLNKVVHFPPVQELRMLRTSRNRNLITAEEQKKLYEATILIIGMSVGSNIVEALVSQGIGKTLILVDMDTIEPSNLNRIRSPYHHVGLDKTEAITRKMWEIDPYLDIISYDDGLNEANLEEILNKFKVDVIVDEMDELRMKIILREAAQQKSLPVVMAADDGDDALIDIERYDLDKDTPIFNGRIPAEVLNRIKQEKLPRAELGIMIGRYFVGAENIPLRMYQSLMEVGKTLPSWPQLGGAAALSGISIAYVIKKILLGQKIKDGRILVSLDEKINLEHLDPSHQAELQKYRKMMGGADA